MVPPLPRAATRRARRYLPWIWAAVAMVVWAAGCDPATGTDSRTGSLRVSLRIDGVPGAPGATIRIVGPTTRSANPAADGRALFTELPAGVYAVTVENPPPGVDFGSSSASASVVAGEVADLEISGVPIRTSTVTGSVFLGADPAGDAEVTLSGPDTRVTRTDPEGAFVASALRTGSYVVSVADFDTLRWTLVSPSVTVGSDEIATVQLTGTRRTGGLMVAVRESGTQEPVGGIAAIVEGEDAGAPSLVTGPDGIAEFASLGTGDYTVRLTQLPSAMVAVPSVRPTRVEADAVAVVSFDVTLAGPGQGSVRGSVLGDETPIPGASVSLVGPNSTRTTETSGDGTFLFAAVDPGDYEVRLADPDPTTWTFDALTAATTVAGGEASIVSFVGRRVAGALAVTTSAVPTLRVGVETTFEFTAAGGDAAYSWTVGGDGLPPGIALDAATGALSGVPSGPFLGRAEVTVTSGTASASRTFDLRVAVSVPETGWMSATADHSGRLALWDAGSTSLLVVRGDDGEPVPGATASFGPAGLDLAVVENPSGGHLPVVLAGGDLDALPTGVDPQGTVARSSTAILPDSAAAFSAAARYSPGVAARTTVAGDVLSGARACSSVDDIIDAITGYPDGSSAIGAVRLRDPIAGTIVGLTLDPALQSGSASDVADALAGAMSRRTGRPSTDFDLSARARVSVWSLPDDATGVSGVAAATLVEIDPNDAVCRGLLPATMVADIVPSSSSTDVEHRIGVMVTDDQGVALASAPVRFTVEAAASMSLVDGTPVATDTVTVLTDGSGQARVDWSLAQVEDVTQTASALLDMSVDGYSVSERVDFAMSWREPVPVLSVLIVPPWLTLPPGQAFQLTTRIGGGNDQTVIAWSVDDPSVLSIDGDGRVTAVGPGLARVIVTAGSKTAESSVSVPGPGSGFGWACDGSHAGANEPNDCPLEATPVDDPPTGLDFGPWFDVAFDGAADRDVFRIDADVASNVCYQIDGLELTEVAQVRVRWLDGAGRLLSVAEPARSGGRRCIQNQPAGTWYLEFTPTGDERPEFRVQGRANEVSQLTGLIDADDDAMERATLLVDSVPSDGLAGVRLEASIYPPGDEDWYRAEIDFAGEICFFASQGWGDIDVEVDLFSPDGLHLIDGTGHGGDYACATNVPAGEWFMRVRLPSDFHVLGTYVARVDTEKLSDDDGRSDADDDTQATATELTDPDPSDDDFGPSVEGSIFESEDTDWYRITVPPTGGQACFETHHRIRGVFTPYLVLRLHDASGNLVRAVTSSSSLKELCTDLGVSGDWFLELSSGRENRSIGLYSVRAKVRTP